MTKPESQLKPNGRAAAAMLAGMIGLLVLGIVQTGTVASSDFSAFVFNVGKAWVPSAAGIGPYSGKETFLLIDGWEAGYYCISRWEKETLI